MEIHRHADCCARRIFGASERKQGMCIGFLEKIAPKLRNNYVRIVSHRRERRGLTSSGVAFA